jgi:hypothetical protein
MTENFYNPDCSWSDAKEEHWRKHDLELVRFRCLVCDTRWYQCYGSDITCPQCGPTEPPTEEPQEIPLDPDANTLFDFWTGEPIARAASND